MAPAKTGTQSRRGRRPRATESRLAVQSKLPASTFNEVFDFVNETLGLNRSDFVAYATVVMANALRAEAGEQPVEMPTYLMEAIEGAKDPEHPYLQEALLEAS